MKKFVFAFAFLSAFSFAADPWEPMTAPVDVPMAVSGNKIVPKIGGAIKVESVAVKSAAADYLLLNRTARPYFPNPTGQIGGLTSKIVQTVKANKPALVGSMKMLIKGPVSAIASTLLYSYLVELGWEWMQDARTYFAPFPIFKESWHTNYSPCKGYGYDLDQLISCANAAAFNNYGGLVKPVSYPYGVEFTIKSRDNGNMGILVRVDKIQTGFEKKPIKDSDIDSAAVAFVDQHPQKAVDTARDKQIPLPISAPGVGVPVIEATPQSQESAASQPTTSSTTSPDGTTTRKDCTDSTLLSFSPDGTVTHTAVRKCTTTITKPDGTVVPGDTSISGTPIVPPNTNTDADTKPPPAVTCDVLGNCDWAKESTIQGIRDQLMPGETPTLDDLAPDPAVLESLKEQVIPEEQFAGPIGSIIKRLGLPAPGGQCNLERNITMFGKTFSVNLMPVSLCSPYHAVVNWLFWGLVALYGWSRLRSFTGYRSQ